MVVEGLKPADTFNARLEFGNMWHVCEEALAAGSNPNNRIDQWTPLVNYARELSQRYAFQREQIDHWYRVCRELFPIYVEHWSRHPDVTSRTPLLQEETFSVPYSLPSGRIVRLRGKWDSVDYLPEHEEDGKRYQAGDWVAENKTKSAIDARKIARQMTYDLQTMLYVIALDRYKDNSKAQNPTVGVRYNVIRRSAHKTPESMLKKVFEDMDTGRIGEWFARWKVEITPADIVRFRRESLDPILEQLCDWWEWVTKSKDPFSPDDGCETDKDRPITSSVHFRFPNGVYNPLTEGAESELDRYLENGSEAGLQRVDNLFPEL